MRWRRSGSRACGGSWLACISPSVACAAPSRPRRGWSGTSGDGAGFEPCEGHHRRRDLDASLLAHIGARAEGDAPRCAGSLAASAHQPADDAPGSPRGLDPGDVRLAAAPGLSDLGVVHLRRRVGPSPRHLEPAGPSRRPAPQGAQGPRAGRRGRRPGPGTRGIHRRVLRGDRLRGLARAGRPLPRRRAHGGLGRGRHLHGRELDRRGGGAKRPDPQAVVVARTPTVHQLRRPPVRDPTAGDRRRGRDLVGLGRGVRARPAAARGRAREGRSAPAGDPLPSPPAPAQRRGARAIAGGSRGGPRPPRRGWLGAGERRRLASDPPPGQLRLDRSPRSSAFRPLRPRPGSSTSSSAASGSTR